MKNFTNNFKQFTSRLSARWLIMALMMLVGTSSAWGATIYFDNSNTKWTNIYLWVGKSKENGADSNYSSCGNSMKHKCGNIYYIDINWDGATEISFTNTSWGNEENSICHRYGWLGGEATHIYKTSVPDANGKVFKASTSKSIAEKNGAYCNCSIGNNQQSSKTFYEFASVETYSESMCCTAPTKDHFTYTAPSNLVYNGQAKAATVTWKAGTGSGTITKYYKSGSGSYSTTAPTNVGTYTVAVKTVAGGNYCATNDYVEVGSFTITCPAVAVPTVVANPSEIIKCGIDFKQRAEITITKLDGLTYTCTLGGNAVTIPNNGPITNIEEAGEYTITATNGCGNSNSTPVTITLTDNTVDISEIFGEPTICAGTKEQVYSIDKITSDGISYSWTLTGEGLNKKSSTDNTVSISADNNAATQTEGVLYATVTKNDCETTSNPKTITLIPLPTITTVDPRSGEACSNTTIADLEKDLTITKSANTNTKWYFKAAEQDVTAMLQAGDYTIKAITETGGCISSQGIVYTVTNIAESPDAPFANNTSEDICASYTEFNLTELVGWDAEAPENENITISWYTKDGENYIHTDADQYTIAANTFYARTQNETGCYSDYVALVIPTPITPATLKLTTTPDNGITTPWVAIKVTVDGSKGAYTVSYPNNLNTVKNIQITKEGDTYTYMIPRPSAWGTGDDPYQNSGKKQVDYTVRATLNDGSEKCPSMGEVIIHLQDEANDTCNH